MKAFNSHIVCYIVTNNFFVSFEINGGSGNPLQNTLRLTNKFEKWIPSFMESLIVDFIQFCSTTAKFFFLQGRLGARLCVHSMSRFCYNFLIFFIRLRTLEVTRTFLFHLRWKKTRITDKKVPKYFVRVCVSSEVGSVGFLSESVWRFSKTSLFS